MPTKKKQQVISNEPGVYVYKNKWGVMCTIDEKTALIVGEKLTPMNDNAKNLAPAPKNSQGEIINKSKF